MGDFSLLTFNCFGTPTPSTGRRLRTLAAVLMREPYDVVCLQEVQAHAYRRLLIGALPGYPSSAHAPHVHAPRGGLLTLARPTILRSQFTLYRDRAIRAAPALMDWLLYKGVLMTEMSCGLRSVVVLNTHLNANYSGDWRRENHYAQIEQRQLAQLAELVTEQPTDALVLVAGDFNIPRGGWLYDELLTNARLCDPLSGDQRATYRTLPGLPARYAQPIDFALLRDPGLPGLRVASQLRFAEPVSAGGAGIYLSDHIAVELRLSWDDP